MEAPKGAFNARLHKVIDVVPVEASQDGIVQRVVRSGWYLNGALLRSAEVIVGKKMA
jgi:molecular chaperone GrpE (heat shock protein)